MAQNVTMMGTVEKTLEPITGAEKARACAAHLGVMLTCWSLLTEEQPPPPEHNRKTRKRCDRIRRAATELREALREDDADQVEIAKLLLLQGALGIVPTWAQAWTASLNREDLPPELRAEIEKFAANPGPQSAPEFEAWSTEALLLMSDPEDRLPHERMLDDVQSAAAALAKRHGENGKGTGPRDPDLLRLACIVVNALERWGVPVTARNDEVDTTAETVLRAMLREAGKPSHGNFGPLIRRAQRLPDKKTA